MTKRTRAKRPGYREAVEWIALNDNSGYGDNEEDVASYMTTHLISDIFGKPEEELAADIMRVRTTYFLGCARGGRW